MALTFFFVLYDYLYYKLKSILPNQYYKSVNLTTSPTSISTPLQKTTDIIATTQSDLIHKTWTLLTKQLARDNIAYKYNFFAMLLRHTIEQIFLTFDLDVLVLNGVGADIQSRYCQTMDRISHLSMGNQLDNTYYERVLMDYIKLFDYNKDSVGRLSDFTFMIANICNLLDLIDDTSFACSTVRKTKLPKKYFNYYNDYMDLLNEKIRCYNNEIVLKQLQNFKDDLNHFEIPNENDLDQTDVEYYDETKHTPWFEIYDGKTIRV